MKRPLIAGLAALFASTAFAVEEPDRVVMDLNEFLNLYESSKNRPDKPEKAPRIFALASANYSGDVILEDDEPVSTVFEARLHIEVLKKEGWAMVPLLPATVAVQSAKIGGKAAPLTLEGGYYHLVTDKKGGIDVDVTFAVGVDTTQGSSGFSFQLVPSGSTSLTLSVPSSDDLDFSVANAKLQEDRTVGNKRILEATLPSTGSLAVRWQREIPEAVQEEEPRIYSQVYTLVGVGDGLLRATATISNTILFAGVDQLQAQIPDGMTLLDVTGAGIRDWTLSDANELTVQLNYEAEGSYNMTLEMEKVLGDDKNLKASAPLVTPIGVERSKGFVGVQALGTLELASGKVEGASPVDVRTLPPSILGVTSQPVLLGYKYLGTDANIPIEIYRHEEVDVLVTLLDQLDATTMFTEDGRRITSVRYDVRNNRRQFLRLELPKKAELWSASVAGRSVQPAAAGDGRLLIPLVRSQSAAGGNLAAFAVEVVYVETGEAPDNGGKGSFSATLPKGDAPTTYAAWTVYAPWDAKISTKSFDGSLKQVEYLSRPLGATTVMQMDNYNAPVAQGAADQFSGGGMGTGAAPVKVSLPLDGQPLAFEKLLVLESDDLTVSFDYKGLK
jgi:hypothetical protein